MISNPNFTKVGGDYLQSRRDVNESLLPRTQISSLARNLSGGNGRAEQPMPELELLRGMKIGSNEF